MKKTKVKLFFLTLLSCLVSAAPLCTVLVLKRGEYFKTVQDAFKLSVGGGILAVCLVIKLVGRFKMPRGIAGSGIIFVLAWLLEAVLADLMLLSGMYLIGEMLDFALFSWQIKRLRENMVTEKNAKATATEVEAVMSKYFGRT